MRFADLRPGWRTDFILHRFDAEAAERDDCLVVRTPSNPTFYWGNCLHLPRLPDDDELDHWLARFHGEITARQPASRHVAIGSAAAYAGERRAGWEAAGFELVVQQMLSLDPEALRPPARASRGAVRLRLLDLAVDSEALIEVEMTDADGFEPVGYRTYLREQHARYRSLGFVDLSRGAGLQRKAPQDRPVGMAPATAA